MSLQLRTVSLQMSFNTSFQTPLTWCLEGPIKHINISKIFETFPLWVTLTSVRVIFLVMENRWISRIIKRILDAFLDYTISKVRARGSLFFLGLDNLRSSCISMNSINTSTSLSSNKPLGLFDKLGVQVWQPLFLSLNCSIWGLFFIHKFGQIYFLQVHFSESHFSPIIIKIVVWLPKLSKAQVMAIVVSLWPKNLQLQQFRTFLDPSSRIVFR